MTITIDVPDHVIEEVTAHGIPSKEINRFAVAGIVAGIADSQTRTLPWDDFFAAMIEVVEPDSPPLSDLAVSREGIYEDHA